MIHMFVDIRFVNVARLAGRLGLAVSRDTLLRRIRRYALREAATPRVLGVDDWAKRKGYS